MRQLIREIFLILVLLASLGAVAVGLAMIHPGLALVAAGVLGAGLWLAWVRRDRPFPEVRAETEQQESDDSGNDDDDGRMEVHPLR